jgi:hypothetical protein
MRAILLAEFGGPEELVIRRSRNLSPEGFTTPDLVDAAARLESLAVPGAAPDGAA